MAIPHQEIAGAFISKFYNDLCAQPGELRALYGVDSTMTCVVDAAATQLFAGQDVCDIIDVIIVGDRKGLRSL